MEAPALVLARGSVWAIVHRTRHGACEFVRLRGVQPHNAAESRTLLTPFDRLRPLEPPAAWRVLRPRAWLHALRRLALHCRPFGTLRTAAAAQIDLLPYQLVPALALLRGRATRVLIADDVGLGKTIQAGLIVSELAAERDGLRALILTPAALRDQWIDELRVRFGLECARADTRWLAATARSLPPDVNPWSMPGIFVASFDLVKRAEVLRPLEDVTWDIVIVDEAHAAGPATDRRAAVHALASRARHVVLLTATPHAGDAEAFEALRRIGRTGTETPDGGVPPLLLFRRSRSEVSAGLPKRTVLLPVRTSRAERRMHRLLEQYSDRIRAESARGAAARGMLAAIVLRKRALSSAGSLLQSAERRRELLDAGGPSDGVQLMLPLGDEDPLDDVAPDAVLGAPALADPAREARLLLAVTAAARRAAGRETKTRFLLRFLQRVQEPVIVFTEYRDTLERLSHALRPSGRRALVLHGGMTTDERTEAQRSFNESGDLLLATDAASEGLNLHGRCRIVVHYELPWNPLRLQQRTGRVDRIGQRRRVHEILLVAADTAESLVLAPLVRRIAAARTATAGGAALFDSLTESRVASAILSNSAIEPVDSDREATPGPEADLAPEAESEAARVLLQRQWLARSGDRLQRERVLSAVGKPDDVGTTAVAIYRVSIRAADGGLLHSELVPAEARLAGAWPAAEAAALVAQPAVREALNAGLRARIGGILAALERTARVKRRREETIAALAPSAARDLVQAGLFDRRGERSASERHEVHRALLAEADERIAALSESAQPTVSLDLVAVLVRGRRR